MPSGCKLLHSFTGHGSQSRDASGDESDGMNETLCPTDFKQAGMIIDDEVNQMLINPIPQGVGTLSLHSLCCLMLTADLAVVYFAICRCQRHLPS